ncbi:hypothetical protein HDU97_001407 [Phlyctochytrium planicorne]|nr:hypothetical protein HDU97_001407 [Phlyctochytrium planicorne]
MAEFTDVLVSNSGKIRRMLNIQGYGFLPSYTAVEGQTKIPADCAFWWRPIAGGPTDCPVVDYRIAVSTCNGSQECSGFICFDYHGVLEGIAEWQYDLVKPAFQYCYLFSTPMNVRRGKTGNDRFNAYVKVGKSVTADDGRSVSIPFPIPPSIPQSPPSEPEPSPAPQSPSPTAENAPSSTLSPTTTTQSTVASALPSTMSVPKRTVILTITDPGANLDASDSAFTLKSTGTATPTPDGTSGNSQTVLVSVVVASVVLLVVIAVLLYLIMRRRKRTHALNQSDITSTHSGTNLTSSSFSLSRRRTHYTQRKWDIKPISVMVQSRSNDIESNVQPEPDSPPASVSESLEDRPPSPPQLNPFLPPRPPQTVIGFYPTSRTRRPDHNGAFSSEPETANSDSTVVAGEIPLSSETIQAAGSSSLSRLQPRQSSLSIADLLPSIPEHASLPRHATSSKYPITQQSLSIQHIDLKKPTDGGDPKPNEIRLEDKDYGKDGKEVVVIPIVPGNRPARRGSNETDTVATGDFEHMHPSNWSAENVVKWLIKKDIDRTIVAIFAQFNENWVGNAVDGNALFLMDTFRLESLNISTTSESGTQLLNRIQKLRADWETQSPGQGTMLPKYVE